MEKIINKIFKEKYPRGLSAEYTKEEMVGYMMAINDIKEQLTLTDVGNCAYLVQDKDTLINHGLFTSEEKAKKYINGNTKYAIQKCDIA